MNDNVNPDLLIFSDNPMLKDAPTTANIPLAATHPLWNAYKDKDENARCFVAYLRKDERRYALEIKGVTYPVGSTQLPLSYAYDERIIDGKTNCVFLEFSKDKNLVDARSKKSSLVKMELEKGRVLVGEGKNLSEINEKLNDDFVERFSLSSEIDPEISHSSPSNLVGGQGEASSALTVEAVGQAQEGPSGEGPSAVQGNGGLSQDVSVISFDNAANVFSNPIWGEQKLPLTKAMSELESDGNLAVEVPKHVDTYKDFFMIRGEDRDGNEKSMLLAKTALYLIGSNEFFLQRQGSPSRQGPNQEEELENPLSQEEEEKLLKELLRESSPSPSPEPERPALLGLSSDEPGAGHPGSTDLRQGSPSRQGLNPEGEREKPSSQEERGLEMPLGGLSSDTSRRRKRSRSPSDFDNRAMKRPRNTDSQPRSSSSSQRPRRGGR